MDAKYYNGEPEDRELRDDLWPTVEMDCAECGAGPDDPCTPDCACGYCLRARARLAAANAAVGE